MGGGEMKYIKEAFKQNWIAPLGPNVDSFEKDISKYFGVSEAAVLTSGTAAIHLALIILGIDRNDEVITSSFTFSATVNPIVYQGATPVLVDSEQDTWNMSPELLETAIKDRLKRGKRLKAIMPVHLYGMPASMDEILKIAEKYEIPVIEDAAESFGSKYKGKPTGTLGDIGIFSFNGNKIITTSGGGALISKQPGVVGKARFLSTQARDAAPYYQHSQIGYNYRMSNILAGIGRGQIEKIEERIRKRREIFSFYKNRIGKIDGISFLEEPDEKYFSNHWLTTILIDPSKTKITPHTLMADLEKENIETRYLWKPMHLQPVFKYAPAYLNGVSEKLFSNGLCLPSGSILTDNELNRTAEIICKSFNR
jgi:dTDP-4-amino-4,6-dideoxygalactose transaminase